MDVNILVRYVVFFMNFKFEYVSSFFLLNNQKLKKPKSKTKKYSVFTTKAFPLNVNLIPRYQKKRKI